MIENEVGKIKNADEREKHVFRDSVELAEYLRWKQEVPKSIQMIVEGKQCPLATGLPLADEFTRAFAEEVLGTEEGAQKVSRGELVTNLLQPLSRVGTEGGYLNVFEIMARTKISTSPIFKCLKFCCQKICDGKNRYFAFCGESDSDRIFHSFWIP